MMKLISICLMLFNLTPFVRCDLNHDGRISTSDIVMFRLGMGEVDANMDGLTNESDVYFLRYYLANRRN